MSRNRKLFVHGTAVEICFRTEEGLPLTATPYIKVLLEAIFARAQSLFRVKVCHFLVMPNHIHMIIVVYDPACVPHFVEYLKRESAHAVNHLLGRKKHTVWADGYDSPLILDSAKMQERICYLYTNPARGNLEDSIDRYPHFSSLAAFLQGGEEIRKRRIPRDSIPVLPQRSMSIAEQQRFAELLEAEGREECSLFIDPDAWMSCFDEAQGKEPERVNQAILQLIRREEENLRRSRKSPVFGAHALRLERMDKQYVPKKRSKRMICLSSSKALRRAFIDFYREVCAAAPRFVHGLDVKELLAKLPAGLFAPGGVLTANINPMFVPSANTVPIFD